MAAATEKLKEDSSVSGNSRESDGSHEEGDTGNIGWKGPHPNPRPFSWISNSKRKQDKLVLPVTNIEEEVSPEEGVTCRWMGVKSRALFSDTSTFGKRKARLGGGGYGG